MSKNLIIVESPTKSKTITKFLPKSYTIKASQGHLRDLPKSRLGVDVDNDFEPKYINIRGKGPLIKELKTAAKKADKVYLATDPDREGEAISWHLAHILGLDEKKAYRVEFHEITKNAVKEALKNPRTIDMDMVDAQQTRRIIDRLVGYKLSPLLWRKIRKGLSAGRVQSVAVKLIADRDAEIEAFIPEEYWTLNVKLREDKKSPIFLADVRKKDGKKIHIADSSEAKKVEKDLEAAAYKVVKATKMKKTYNPPAPYTTSTLQQEASSRLNFNTKRTMSLAQRLYEGMEIGKGGAVGLITYMRTDSTRLSDEAVAEIRSLAGQLFGPEYVPAGKNVFKNKNGAQDAHEAIRPTSVKRTPSEVKPYLRDDEYKLYKMIWERAMASQMAGAVYEQTNLTIEAGAYELGAGGSVQIFDGFRRLDTKKDRKDKILPYIAKGTDLLLHKVEQAEQHFTEPPAHYTEASLVKELEDKGIGRPSTYSPTIQTILSRGYVARDGKRLVATELGVQVVEMLLEYFNTIISVDFSRALEDELDGIAENKIAMLEVLRKFYDPFSVLLEKADKQIVAVPEPVIVSDVKCEKCGRMMVVKNGRFGKFLACPGFPNCRNTKPILEKIGLKCPKCKTGDIVVRKTRRGKVMYGCSEYRSKDEGCDFVSWIKPVEKTCEICGTIMAEDKVRGKEHYYCLNPLCVNAKPERKKSKTKKTAKTATKGNSKTAKAAEKTAKTAKTAKSAGKASIKTAGKSAAIGKLKETLELDGEKLSVMKLTKKPTKSQKQSGAKPANFAALVSKGKKKYLFEDENFFRKSNLMKVLESAGYTVDKDKVDHVDELRRNLWK